jgi:hypothetical protein
MSDWSITASCWSWAANMNFVNNVSDWCRSAHMDSVIDMSDRGRARSWPATISSLEDSWLVDSGQVEGFHLTINGNR